MSINIFQAIILGLFASLSSMPGLGGTSIGNYTLGRPLIGVPLQYAWSGRNIHR